MQLWYGVNLTADAYVGTYRLKFKDVPNTDALAQVATPIDVIIEGKSATVLNIQVDKTKKTASIDVDLKENPIPVMAIVIGVLAVIGLGIGYMSLESVEKLVDNPFIDIAIVTIFIIVVFVVFKMLRKK